MASEELLTYEQIASRLEKAFGVRPSLSSLRKRGVSVSKPRKLGTARISTGMPAPVAEQPGHPSLFSASQIDAWIAEHPLQHAKKMKSAIARASKANRATAVSKAHSEGMSWADIAAVLSEVDGVRVSRQAVHERYGKA